MEQLVNVLWGVIGILCLALGFFLVMFFTGLNKSKTRQWKVIDDILKRVIELEAGDKLRKMKCDYCETDIKRLSTKVYNDATELTALRGRVEKLEYKK